MNAADSSAVPAPLAKPVPRQTALWGTGHQAMALICLMILFAAGAWAFYGVRTLHNTNIRDTLRIQSSQVFADNWYLSKGTVYYTFDVDGTSYSGSAQASGAVPLPPHSLLPIRYQPSNPARSHPAAWEWSPTSDLPLALFPAIMLVPATVLIVALRKERWLLIYGTPAPGEITASVRGSKGGISLKYQFRAADGGVYAGSGPGASLKDPGTPIWVLYDPANPSRNQPYPAPNYRAVP